MIWGESLGKEVESAMLTVNFADQSEIDRAK